MKLSLAFGTWATILGVVTVITTILAIVSYFQAFGDDIPTVFQQQAALQRATIYAIFAGATLIATAICASTQARETMEYRRTKTGAS